MRIVVYDEAGDVALDHNPVKETVSLCPGRLEKARVVERCRRRRSSSWAGRPPPPRAATFASLLLKGMTENDGVEAVAQIKNPSQGRTLAEAKFSQSRER
jgi:hypothetical protein